MSTKQDEQEDLAALLPWYVAGTLSEADARRVAAAIDRDPDMARQLDIVREEAAETLLLNESLGVPSRRAADRLFTAIDAEPASTARRSLGMAGWLDTLFSGLRPRTLALASAAALAIIALQAGFLVSKFGTQSGSSTYQTATAVDPVPEGPQILVNFAPNATVAEIEALLKTIGGTIVEGPYAGGLYRVRIGPSDLDKAGIDRVVEMLRGNGAVRFVAPGS